MTVNVRLFQGPADPRYLVLTNEEIQRYVQIISPHKIGKDQLWFLDTVDFTANILMGYMNASTDALRDEITVNTDALDTRLTGTETEISIARDIHPTLDARLDAMSLAAGAVTTVFGRAGDISPVAGDYSFAQIGATPTTLGGYGITDAASDTDLLSLETDITNGTVEGPLRGELANSTTGGGLIGYTPPSTGLATTIRGFLDSLWTSTGATLIRWKSSAIGAITRTIANKFEDYVDVTDFGAVGDGVTDCSPAVRLAYDHAVATGKGIRYPTGTFMHHSKITMTTPVSIKGDGWTDTFLKINYNGPLFEFDNAVKPNYKVFRDFRFRGTLDPITNTSTCCFLCPPTSKGIGTSVFANILVGGCYAFFRVDGAPEPEGGTGGWRGVCSWNSFININLRSNVKYGFLWNKGSGTGNSWHGGKPMLDISGGAYIEINGDLAPENENKGVNVGDIIINDVHAAVEGAADVLTMAFFRGGPNTTYRSRILLSGCQFDAKADYPLDLSAVGATNWSNIICTSNNMGGNANIASKIPPVRAMQVQDQGVSDWRSQARGGTSSTTVVDQLAFRVSLGATTGCLVKIYVSGGFGAHGSAHCLHEFMIRRGAAAPTFFQTRDVFEGNPSTSLAVIPVVNGNDLDLYVRNATGSGTSEWDAQLTATGGTFKIQNRRWLI